MSFPAFRFADLLEQEWEDSDVYQQMVSARFLFVIFSRNNRTETPVMRRAFFWNMPSADIDELHRVWTRTRVAIRHGAGLRYENGIVRNTLPKASESYLAHVRPHTGRAAYVLADGTIIGNPDKNANPLPDGQWMTTQSFWFNKEYIKQIVENENLFI